MPDEPAAPNIFFTDENVNGDAIEIAREAWNVQIVRAVDVGLKQTPDPVLFRYAIEHHYIMVTGNIYEFAPLVKEWMDAGNDYPGIIYITRKHYQDATYVATMLAICAEGPMTNRAEWI